MATKEEKVQGVSGLTEGTPTILTAKKDNPNIDRPGMERYSPQEVDDERWTPSPKTPIAQPVPPTTSGASRRVVDDPGMGPRQNTPPPTESTPPPTPPPAPTAKSTTAATSSVELGQNYQDVRNQLVGNQGNPQLPESAKQTYTPVQVKPEEFVDPNAEQIEELNPAVATKAVATGYNAAQAAVAAAVTPAEYKAAQATAAVAAKAVKGEVSKLVTPGTATVTNAEAAYQALDEVDPKTLAEAVTHDLPDGATVKGQLDSLLQGLEEGDVPVWARPAVAAAESQMAARGMSSSSVGRNALFNSIIQSAMPIAQQDAKAKLSVFQQDISNEQQTALANSAFFQNLTVKNLDNRQQAAIVNATNATNVDVANAANMTQASIQNAKNFLTMDIANMTNEQQTNMANAQFRQQAMLSNQAAENTARQFNATSQNQANQFNANLAASVAQFNTNQQNTARQFAAGSMNQASLSNAQIQSTLSQFNSQQEYNRQQFNTQNAVALAQSNVQWRRQVNQANTAGVNAVNQANAMNQFNLSNQALTFLWQEQRDAAKWVNDNTQNAEERKTRMALAAIGNESLKDSKTMANIKALAGAAASLFDNWGN